MPFTAPEPPQKSCSPMQIIFRVCMVWEGGTRVERKAGSRTFGFRVVGSLKHCMVLGLASVASVFRVWKEDILHHFR